MTLPNNLVDREFQKFIEYTGDTAVRVYLVNPTGGGTGSVTGGDLTTVYNEVSAVVSGSETLISQFTATVNSWLVNVLCSGENIARYRVEKSSSTISQKYTHFTNLGADFFFGSEQVQGIPLLVGENIKVYVLHNRPSTAKFNATLEILETA